MTYKYKIMCKDIHIVVENAKVSNTSLQEKQKSYEITNTSYIETF